MRPTIERLSIYQKMLDILTQATIYFSTANRIEYIIYKGKNHPIAFSGLIERITEEKKPKFEEYPELHAQKPDGAADAGLWWPATAEGLKQRKQSLKIAIELCQTTVGIGA